MAERFLIDVLKLPWHKAHEEAERFQDAMSEEVEQRIMALLGGPATCPHGNPIPGTGATLSLAISAGSTTSPKETSSCSSG